MCPLESFSQTWKGTANLPNRWWFCQHFPFCEQFLFMDQKLFQETRLSCLCLASQLDSTITLWSSPTTHIRAYCIKYIRHAFFASYHRNLVLFFVVAIISCFPFRIFIYTLPVRAKTLVTILVSFLFHSSSCYYICFALFYIHCRFLE